MCAASVTAPPALRFGALWSSAWCTLAADLPELWPALPGVRRWDAQFDRSHFFRRASPYCLLPTPTVHRLTSVPSRGRRTARSRRLYSRDTRRCHAVRASNKRTCTSEVLQASEQTRISPCTDFFTSAAGLPGSAATPLTSIYCEYVAHHLTPYCALLRRFSACG